MHLHFFQQHAKKQVALLSTILVPQGKKQARKRPFYKALRAFKNYSNSTKPNQFCLEIILCRIRGAFDYLMYPYYPAYMG